MVIIRRKLQLPLSLPNNVFHSVDIMPSNAFQYISISGGSKSRTLKGARSLLDGNTRGNIKWKGGIHFYRQMR